MALEKGTFARRKAQKLARDGEIDQAIEEMRLLVGDAESNPYDHVYLGDLLMREGRPQEALDAWMEAVHSYGRAGLHRNAIAVGKKVLRLDHSRVAVHRTLGELYCQEGLLGEAMPHFLFWLDTVDGDAAFSEEFLETLDRAGSTVGLQVEVALRVGDHFIRAGHNDRAARMLHELADKVQAAGSPELASELRDRAHAAERRHLAQAQLEPAADGEAGDEPAVVEPSLPPAGTGGWLDGSVLGSDEFEGSEGPKGPGETATAGSPGIGPNVVTPDPFPEISSAEPGPEAPIDPMTLPIGPSVAERLAPADAESRDVRTAAFPEPEVGTDPEALLTRAETFLGASGRAAETSEVVGSETDTGPGAVGTETAESRAVDPDAGRIEHFPMATGFALASPDPEDLDGDTDAGRPATDREDAKASSSAWDGGAASQESEGAEHSAAAEEVETEEGRIWDLDAEQDPSVSDPDSSVSWNEATDAAGVSQDPDAEPAAEPGGVSLRSLIDHADSAYDSGRWAEARGLYDRAAHEGPLEPTVLRRLVEVARKLDDPAAEVHYLEQLGDAWIEAGVMEEALEAFLEVLRIDPDSCVARRRLSRFQEMGVPGAARIPEATRESVQGVLESAGARTSVRDDPASAIQSDEWIDLGALIEEFREGIKNQIAGTDAAGHYDLAVSHHGMELFEEAVEDLDLVLGCPDLTVELELHARELRGACLLALRRHREAVHEFRTALERPVPDAESRCSLLYHLGVALESAEEWREAAEIFDRVRDELPGFLDAEARQHACELRANGADPDARAA